VGTGLAYDSFSSGVTNLRSASYVSGQGFFTADDRRADYGRRQVNYYNEIDPYAVQC